MVSLAWYSSSTLLQVPSIFRLRSERCGGIFIRRDSCSTQNAAVHSELIERNRMQVEEIKTINPTNL